MKKFLATIVCCLALSSAFGEYVFMGGGSGSGSGDVVGPSSSTDNAIARFDGVTGKLLKNSVDTIANTSGALTMGGPSSANILWTTEDSTSSIGAKGANRPGNIYSKFFSVIGTYEDTATGGGITIAANPAGDHAAVTWKAHNSTSWTDIETLEANPGDLQVGNTDTGIMFYLKKSGIFELAKSSSANINWTTDGAGSIGTSLTAGRPSTANIKSTINVGGGIGGSGSVSGAEMGVANGQAEIGLNPGTGTSDFVLIETRSAGEMRFGKSALEWLYLQPTGTISVRPTTGANIIWNTDGAGNIGDITHRPNNVWAKTAFNQGGAYNSTGAAGATIDGGEMLLTPGGGASNWAGMFMTASNQLRFNAGSGLEWLRMNASGSFSIIPSSGAHLLWNTDGSGDIGASGATRPNNVYVKNTVVANGDILNVTSNGAGPWRMESATLASGTCAATQTGTWIASATHTSTGKCTLDITGAFSAAPHCTLSNEDSNPSLSVFASAVSSTSIVIDTYTNISLATMGDKVVHIMCQGAR